MAFKIHFILLQLQQGGYQSKLHFSAEAAGAAYGKYMEILQAIQDSSQAKLDTVLKRVFDISR